MNNLIKRQIQKCLWSIHKIPPDLLPFLEAVSETYDGYESDRLLFERSLEVSSQELRQVNQRLRTEIQVRMQAEEQQGRLLQEIVQINEELTHFVHVIAHDLKTPIRGISTLATWLMSDHHEGLDPEAQRALDLIDKRSRRMHHLIADLMEYARFKPSSKAVQEVDLQALLNRLIEREFRRDTVQVTFDAPLPVIVCEPDKIEKIFSNLMTNAVQFNDKPQVLIQISCCETPTHWQFAVRDNGPGIDPRYHEKIFGVFQTLDSWQDTDARSTGIGLAIVRKAVEIHGGRVWVESQPGRGCTIHFTLAKVQSSHWDVMDCIQELKQDAEV